MKRKRIDSIAGLVVALQDYEEHDFALVLNGGLISSKTLRLLKNGKIKVLNNIDNSTQTLKPEQLNDYDLTNIGKGILKGSFYAL